MTIAQRTLTGTDEGSAQVMAPYCGKEFTVTFACDAGNVYAAADLVSDLVEIANFAEQAGGSRMLRSVTVLDKADQTASAYSLVFAQTSTSLGTINSAPNISDANLLADKLKFVPIASTDWLDVGGAKVATIRNIELPLTCAAGATSIWVGVINGAGTPTFGASDLVAHLSAA